MTRASHPQEIARPCFIAVSFRDTHDGLSERRTTRSLRSIARAFLVPSRGIELKKKSTADVWQSNLLAERQPKQSFVPLLRIMKVSDHVLY